MHGMNDKPIYDKIRKLFKLADKTNQEGEAQAALLAAQRLMVKHRIELSDIQSIVEEDDPILTECIQKDRWMICWKTQLVQVVAENFRCKVFIRRVRYSNPKQGQTLTMIVGRQQDVQIVQETARYAIKEAEHYYRQWRKREPVNSREYYWGFVAALENKLQDQVTSNQWQMIVRPDAGVEKAFRDRNLGHAREQKELRLSFNASFLKGLADGNRFDPHRHKLETNPLNLLGD